MAEKMPQEIWLQAPIDTPEKGWKAGEVTWCWHPINENEDNEPDTKYLRADTCTPNEECVSKAELENVMQKHETVIANCIDDATDPREVILYGLQKKLVTRIFTELREVMDK